MCKIRPMQIEDVDSVAAIEAQVQSHPWQASQFKQSIKHHQCHVLLVKQSVVGFCIFQTVLDESNLLLIAIAPNQQKKGLGKYLLEQTVLQLGAEVQSLFLEVRASNLSAIHLYQSVGFDQIDIRKNYYPSQSGNGYENAVLMARYLG